MIKYKDINVERHAWGLTLYALKDNELVKEKYSGYTIAQAKKIFYYKINNKKGYRENCSKVCCTKWGYR